jgi:hypothetical protein
MEVSATEAALDLINDLKSKYGDDLIFHQSGGCCDGSAPMCYEAKDFFLRRPGYKAWRNRWCPFLYE